MKVVFLAEVEGTARTGDVKNVAAGFARNFLLPRKLAAPATDHYIAIAQARATKEARRQDRVDEEARNVLLPKVEGITIRTEVRVGEQGKLFGSVTARDIAELVHAATKIEVEHKQIDLREPIRELGAFPINVKLTRNVIAKISLSVEPLGGAEVAEAEPEAAVEPQAEAEAPDEAEDEPQAVAEAEPVIEAEPEATGERQDENSEEKEPEDEAPSEG